MKVLTDSRAKDYVLQAAALLQKKAEDYGTGNENFTQAAKFASLILQKEFKAVDAAAILLGVKIARYANLISSDQPPNFESIGDTVIDMINYIALMEDVR